jgi:hypothetical protein
MLVFGFTLISWICFSVCWLLILLALAQVQDSRLGGNNYTGLRHAFRSIIEREGFRALYTVRCCFGTLARVFYPMMIHLSLKAISVFNIVGFIRRVSLRICSVRQCLGVSTFKCTILLNGTKRSCLSVQPVRANIALNFLFALWFSFILI